MSGLIIKQKEYYTDDFDSSLLKLNFSGVDVDYSIINSLRKICLNQVPIYAFHPNNINILRNNSVFDSSEMKLRLSQLPIKRLFHNLKFLPMKYYNIINNTQNLSRHLDDEYNVEIYIKDKNDTTDKIKNVTTNDIKISINGEIIKNSEMYSEKNPILLIQLRTGEEFECSMKSTIAVGEFDTIFNSSNTYYEEINENNYNLSIESNGQFNEYELLIRGCEIIIEKFNIIKNDLNSDNLQGVITDSNSMILEIKNEDYTCGNPINYILQNMKEVLFSGISKPNFMEKNIVIKFKVNNNYKPLDILLKAIDKSINLYDNILNNIKKIKKG